MCLYSLEVGGTRDLNKGVVKGYNDEVACYGNNDDAIDGWA